LQQNAAFGTMRCLRRYGALTPPYEFLSLILSKILGQCAALAALIVATVAPAQPQKQASWFVQAGAVGDGTSVESPTGSVESLNRLSGEGDRIYLLPSDAALEGGIALKVGQRLIGLDREGRKPVITNSDSTRNHGCGVVLSIGSHVSNVRIEGTVASGIYGRNVAGVRIDRVDVHDANRLQSFIDATFPTLPGRLPHGGMVFVHSDSPADVEVTFSTVTQTSGFGIVSITSGVARTRLSVSHTRVEGGSRIGFFDIGIAALVKDRKATTRLDISDAEVRGRLSPSGRNVMIAASGGGHGDARIKRIASGPTGQDGIAGAVMQSPSEITIHISDSVIEDAGQMNVEGSLINLPPEDSAQANAARVSIEIERSIVRRAGAVSGFEEVASNVWLGGSQFIKDGPPAVGHYRLRMTGSRIEGAGRSGLEFGNRRITASGHLETSAFDVLLRGNTIAGNGEADVMMYAPRARVDARKNCWGRPEGLAENRILVSAPARRSQLDAAEPLSCNERTKGPRKSW